MVIVTVCYPKTNDSHFDFEYYQQRHLPIVDARWTEMGLEKFEVLRGISALDGTPPNYLLIALLHFSSVEHLRSAVSKHGEEIIGDIANFTNVQPFIQINEAL